MGYKKNTLDKKQQKVGITKLITFNGLMVLLFICVFGLIPSTSLAKKLTFKKTQEVDFSEMSLKGTVRNPEGAYLVQKKGIKFLPLYEIQKDLDQKIRDSIQYTR